MSNTSTQIRFRLRQDTDADWNSRNPVLALGEQGLNLSNGQIKTGDGVSTWSALKYTGNVTSTTQLPMQITPGLVAPANPNVNDVWLDIS